MPALLKTLPFDERNDQDFEELTQRIRQALDLVRKNRSLKPTQNTLARLAQCSRKTLHLRRWPVEQLKSIRNQRLSNPESGRGKTKTKHEAPTENQLIAQIRNYQSQNGKLFDQVQYFEHEQTTWTLVRKALEEDLATAKEKIQELEKALRSKSQVKSPALKLVGSGCQ
jgi:hypothetical protein